MSPKENPDKIKITHGMQSLSAKFAATINTKQGLHHTYHLATFVKFFRGAILSESTAVSEF